MFNPLSTYRLQFHKGFTFKDLEHLLPYLKKLGIKTIYASPVFRAVPGSMHGYDGVNPNQVSPEIGTTEQLKELSKLLHNEGMHWLQDIVPNHMAYHYHNLWLMDVLEKGRQSEYASFFDISWNTDSSGKILAPFLARSLEEALEKNELQVSYEDQKLVLTYFDNHFPLNEESRNIIESQHTNITEAINNVNTNKALLQKIIREQFYSLVHWKETDSHINYRRFFTVNGLLSLNIQDQQVFDEVHQHALCCVKEGVFDGLRVDHIDGLYDPASYLQTLRGKCGEPTYIIVEKILKYKEALPQWPIQGNTGYDFLALVNNLLTNKKNENAFTNFYQEISGDKKSIEKSLTEKKEYILEHHLAGDLDNLCSLFLNSELATEQEMQAVSRTDLRQVIGQVLIHCPVYRFYPGKFPLTEEEETQLETILNKIKAQKENTQAVELLELVFFQKPTWKDQAYCEKVLQFYRRCMQFTGPLMAKGMEDTLMYTYNRFIGHNEVGDSPEFFGISPAEFHEAMLNRQEHWPLSLNATSTHDTKRGEDARARLNVLTDLPEEWFKAVREWQQLNAELKKNNAPGTNDEYFIYQTLVATFPMRGDEQNYLDRLLEYVPKFLREAKVHSTWSEPNEEYEEIVKNFVSSILEKKSSFLKSFLKFYEKIKTAGIINSLSQLILKHTCPGVPDSYQGTELWDLSLVDPDNRRAVDYELRKTFLEECLANENKEVLLNELWNNREDGKIKLFLTHHLLHLRQQNEKLFGEGFYIPLEVTGEYANNILAFARCYQYNWIVVIVPLHYSQIHDKKFKADMWKDTAVILPAEAPDEWKESFSETTVKGRKLLLSELCKILPLAVFQSRHKENKRSSGVLLPVSALPSIYGIGDFGPAAKNFIDFLRRSAQKYWQLLPLNPSEAENAFSPYSSSSGMAGNPMYISLELLEQDKLLAEEDLKAAHSSSSDLVLYEEAKIKKYSLYKKAFSRFLKNGESYFKKEFSEFCTEQDYWLNDFATYIILKEKYNLPWHEWPEEYKSRNHQALNKLQKEHANEFEYICWKQFVFHKQWKELKAYAHKSGVQLFGDLPFYLSHDSADVWANPGLFSLDEKSQLSKTAGVPPDYFSKEGQLWGMPTFKWEVLKQQNYKWWITRLRKNLELFDLLRIDHFRALDQFWEVSAKEKNAVNGQWLPGPKEDFFQAIERELGQLPFVAEDLGDNMETVYHLRDTINLPGMKVLQYAFGENISSCVDIPHNYKPECIVYSGTHDNNTTLGWFKNELSKKDLMRLEKYTGNKVTEKNCTEVILRLAYASVANGVIVTMQDLLDLDKEARLNTPGTNKNNWMWKLKPEQLTKEIEKKLRDWTLFYNRI